MRGKFINMSEAVQIVTSILMLIAGLFIQLLAFTENLHVPFDQAYIAYLGFVLMITGIICLVRASTKNTS